MNESPSDRFRPSVVEVDLGAIRHNVSAIAAHCGSPVLAIVKANGYGHGAVEVARAALESGAFGLGVALVEEGIELRSAGIDARILILSEPPISSVDAVIAHRLEATVYSEELCAALDVAAQEAKTVTTVHLKLDTGMRRVGIEVGGAQRCAEFVERANGLELGSVYTHFAVADEPQNSFTAQQLDLLTETVAELRRRGINVKMMHAANSAGALAHPASALDLVRIGIAMYGIAPSEALKDVVATRPALRLVSEVSHVKTVAAGERISYGLRYQVERETVIATVPIGYADGVRRQLFERGGEVLIGGRRWPIAGTVTMDQLMVNCGAGSTVERGAPVVLLGTQGNETISVDDWARRLRTIGYEVTCGLTARLPRVYG